MSTTPHVSYWTHDGIDYQLVCSRDAGLDGGQLIELNDLSAIAREGDRTVMSALRNNSAGTIRLTFNRALIRLELIERFIALVRAEWTDQQPDG